MCQFTSLLTEHFDFLLLPILIEIGSGTVTVIVSVNYSTLLKVPGAYIVIKIVITEQVNAKMEKGDFHC